MYILLFNGQCMASPETNFSLVGLFEIYPLEISSMPIDSHKKEKKRYIQKIYENPIIYYF